MASAISEEPPRPYEDVILEKELEALHERPQDPPPYDEKPVRRISQHKRKASSELVPVVAPKIHRPPKPRNACPACYYRYLREVLRAWVLSQRKPYSAVTVSIDRLTSEQYEEDDLSGIIDLIEVIRIQASGPTEAARAIRKKLKYGNPHRQLRALVILDGLMQNAGSRFQRSFADEPLLERLRILPKDDMVDQQVRNKCNLLFRQWATAYKDTAGMERIATLYKQLPARPIRRPQPAQSRVIRETEYDAHADHDSSSPATPTSHTRNSVASSSSPSRPVTLSPTPSTISSWSFSKKDKKNKNKPFNLEKEKPQLLETIASANLASTNLNNALQLVNRENERVSENQEVVKRFEACKVLRRQILRYVQLVESDQYIGSLLSANDELVKALMAYEIMDKSIEDDSDSDAESFTTGKSNIMGRENELAGLSLNSEAAPAKPPRPAHIPMPSAPPVPAPANDSEEEENEADEDDPFGDSHAVKTPHHEKGGMTWKDV